jgi:hypothetical protein
VEGEEEEGRWMVLSPFVLLIGTTILPSVTKPITAKWTTHKEHKMFLLQLQMLMGDIIWSGSHPCHICLCTTHQTVPIAQYQCKNSPWKERQKQWGLFVHSPVLCMQSGAWPSAKPATFDPSILRHLLVRYHSVWVATWLPDSKWPVKSGRITGARVYLSKRWTPKPAELTISSFFNNLCWIHLCHKIT